MPYPGLHTKAQKQAKVKERMHTFKEGGMHSGTGVPGERQKEPVTNPKQAIAIALSETGQSKEHTMHHKGSKHHSPEHRGFAEHHIMHHERPKAEGPKGHKHHAVSHEGFAHHSPHHSEAAKSHHDGKEHGGEHFNPVEHGYGFGKHHDGSTDHGAHIAGGEGKHAHDNLKQSIAGDKLAGEGESRLRSHDNPHSDARQARGRPTGEKRQEAKPEGKERGYSDRRDGHSIATKDGPAYRERRAKEEFKGGRYTESYQHPEGYPKGELGHPSDKSHEHHIAGGEHQHHAEHSGKAEHHPSVAHQESHRFHGHNTPGTHGFGHAVHQRHGHHRHSGHPHAHRIGHKD